MWDGNDQLFFLWSVHIERWLLGIQNDVHDFQKPKFYANSLIDNIRMYSWCHCSYFKRLKVIKSINITLAKGNEKKTKVNLLCKNIKLRNGKQFKGRGNNKLKTTTFRVLVYAFAIPGWRIELTTNTTSMRYVNLYYFRSPVNLFLNFEIFMEQMF